MSAAYRQRPRRRPAPGPASDGTMPEGRLIHWRTLCTLVAAFLMSWGLLQFIWAAREIGLGGQNALDGAANEANGLRTGLSGLALLALVVLVSLPSMRRVIRTVWVRVIGL